MNTLPCELGTFLADLRGRGVSLWPDGERLHVLPATKLTPAEVEHLRTNKAAVLGYLRQRNADLLPSEAVCREWQRRYCNAVRPTETNNPKGNTT